MNIKHIIAGTLLLFVFLSVISCATKEAAEETETTETTEGTAAEDAATDYDPAVVDQLSEDFEELDWQKRMKKLIINGLLILVFVILIIAVVMGLSKLRAVDETEEQTADMIAGQESAVAEEKAIQEETAVKVTVSNATNTNSSKTSSSYKTSSSEKKTSDSDVDDFLNSLD